ncbi:cytochrome P450 [Streptomyces sp. NPDC091279]|uniref:cytochrome P450 n=1 Tax=unclassified Streptomyces TaxID=2593676 RepID=UPI00381F1268
MPDCTGMTAGQKDGPDPVPFPQDRTCPYHPPAAYDPLRATRPLARVTHFDGREAWLVTGHAVARELLADRRLTADRTRPGFPAHTFRFAPSRERAALLGVDDPEHRAQRRMVAADFTLKRTSALRPRIQQIVDERLDAMIAQGPPVDLVAAFALPVPSMVICALLGVPYDDHDFFEEQSRRLLRGPGPGDVRDARERLGAYVEGLIDRKREEPGAGLLDDLVRRELRSGEVDRAYLVNLAFILLVAGHETTANMISLGVFTLLQHPERLAELRSDPGLLPDAVEELMRLLSIADMLRMAVEDIEIAGTTIRAGEGVIFSAAVINRDESVYGDPDGLDWRRPVRHHVAFGFGIHQCLGQNLARAELEIALHALFDRLPGLRLAVPPDEIPFKPAEAVQGLLELPVTW